MKNQIERAGVPSWSKTMAEVQPCGHTNAQHLYHDSGDIKIDLSACSASGPPSTGQASGGVTAGAPTASAAPEPSRGAQRAAEVILSKFGEAHSHWVEHCAEIIDRESGHVVLLEALKSIMQSLDDWLCDDTISEETMSEMLTLEDEILKLLRKFEAEAAIKQAERT